MTKELKMGDKSEADLNQPTSFLFCIISYNFVVPHILIFDIDIDINLEIDIDIDKPSEVRLILNIKSLHGVHVLWSYCWIGWTDGYPSSSQI